MRNKYNAERISRKAETLQWTGENTKAVMEFLAKHGMIGELFRAVSIMVRKQGCIVYTLHHGEWLVEGEDKVLRFYTDDAYRPMYQPINDELERLRAFAREVIAAFPDDFAVLSFAVQQKLLVPQECGLALDLAESLKAPA